MSREARQNMLLLLGGVGLLASAWAVGLVDLFSDVERARKLLDTGVLGESLFVVIASVLYTVGVPPVLFFIPAALIFPPHVAFTLSMLVGVLGSYFGFVLARTVGRSWVEKRIPSSLRKWDDQLARNGLMAVFLIRLALFLMPPVSWFLGVSRVRTAHFLVGTTVGIIPGTLISAYVGGTFLTWLVRQPPWVWALMIGVGALAFGVSKRVRSAEA